jgi:hypothetical protein
MSQPVFYPSKARLKIQFKKSIRYRKLEIMPGNPEMTQPALHHNNS